MVYFLCVLMKPVGHSITGVQNTMLLSRTMVLLAFNGAFAAADATDPASRLLVSLTTDVPLLELDECYSATAALAFFILGAMI